MTLRDLLGEVLQVATPPGALGTLIDELLPDLMGGGAVRQSVERILRRRVAAQEGRSGAALLCRALTKQVDYLTGEAEMRVVPLGARAELADRLADGAALKLAEAASLLSEYSALSAAVVRIKAGEGVEGEGDLNTARAARERHREAIRRCLSEAFLVLSGASEEDDRR